MHVNAHLMLLFMYYLVLFQWYVFNIFATYTLGKGDVNNFEKKKTV